MIIPQQGTSLCRDLQRDHFFDSFIRPAHELVISSCPERSQPVQIYAGERTHSESSFCVYVSLKGHSPTEMYPIISGCLQQFPACCGIMVASVFNFNHTTKPEGAKWYVELMEGISRNMGYTKILYAAVAEQIIHIQAFKERGWKEDSEGFFTSRRTLRNICVYTKNLEGVPYTYGQPKKKGEYQNEVLIMRQNSIGSGSKTEVFKNWGIY